MSSQRRSKLGPVLASLPLAFSFGTLAGQAFAQRMPEAAKGPSVAWRASTQAKPSDYVGWEVCAGCHRAQARVFVKTPHALAGEKLPTSPSTPAARISPSAAAGKKIYDDRCARAAIRLAARAARPVELSMMWGSVARARFCSTGCSSAAPAPLCHRCRPTCPPSKSTR